MTCCDNPAGDSPDRVLFGGRKGGGRGWGGARKNNLFFIRIDATETEKQ